MCYLGSLGPGQLLSQLAIPGAERSDLLVSVHHLLQVGLESLGDGVGAEVKQQVETALILDFAVGESSLILELLTSKDQSLPDKWNSFLVLR